MFSRDQLFLLFLFISFLTFITYVIYPIQIEGLENHSEAIRIQSESITMVGNMIKKNDIERIINDKSKSDVAKLKELRKLNATLGPPFKPILEKILSTTYKNENIINDLKIYCNGYNTLLKDVKLGKFESLTILE